MTSQTLRDARRYEEAMAQNITDQETGISFISKSGMDE